MFLKIRVKVGARKESVIKKDEDTFLISVKEKAERNEANLRVRQIISNLYGLSIGKVQIIKGQQSPSKILKIDFGKDLV